VPAAPADRNGERSVTIRAREEATVDRSRTVAWLGLIALFPLAASAVPPPQGKGQGKEKTKAEAGQSPEKQDSGRTQQVPERAKGTQDGREAEAVPSFLAGFTAAEAHRHAVELGLTGAQALPPGIVKNLARGKPLPPGIAKRGLPSHYAKRLPHGDGYEWWMAGLDLILVSSADKLVREIYRDVFR